MNLTEAEIKLIEQNGSFQKFVRAGKASWLLGEEIEYKFDRRNKTAKVDKVFTRPDGLIFVIKRGEG
jgi:hypothetical protein